MASIIFKYNIILLIMIKRVMQLTLYKHLISVQAYSDVYGFKAIMFITSSIKSCLM